MSVESSDNAKDIFLQAIEIESAEYREAFLNQACRHNHSLRKRVDALLIAHERPESLLDRGPVGEHLPPTVESAGFDERAGNMIGPYKLREQIGEGGMGVVYVAEQTWPVKRKVALKVIKPGMDTKEVVARFEAERQALAMMDHPSIAKVFDAGMTDSGRPYFAMELINGVPITKYCDDKRLGIRGRLELFVHVCNAIQHAHQKGVIHRDVKPSNVLVTLHDGHAVPVVIDFGVAKATNQNLSEQTVYTRLNQVIGTTLYMSPEQAELSRYGVDTRTDIYALGVLLYELLTGTTPFDQERLTRAAFDEVRRIIREEEPPRPSTRVSGLGETATEVSSHRGTDPAKLRHSIRGDLDWIVMKALEKDRKRRYDSASRFAEDVENYLGNRLVEARPPSTIYQLQKAWSRNRSLVSTVGTILLSLLICLAVATWAWRSQQRTNQRLTATLDRLSESMLQEALLAALGGNKERAKERLTDLDRDELKVADGDLELLKALVAMTDNDFRQAIESASESIKKESSILGKDRVGARAIKAVANYWIMDSIGLIELEARELQEFEPETDMDKLLLAYATIGHAPERTKELIESIESSYRRTPVGLLIQTQCGNSIAADHRDVAGLISASQDLHTATFLLDDSELAKTWELSALTCAIEIASQNGNIEDTTDWIRRGKKIADELTTNNLNAWYRWKFYSSAGFASEAEAACRERTQRDCFFIASECLMNLGLDDVKAKFDELTNFQYPDSPFAKLVRAHILANQVDAKQKIVDSISPLLQAPGPITRRHALAVLCLVCSADEVRDYALSSKRSKTFESLEDVWKGELMVSYYAGDFDKDELLARCGDHAFTLSNAHYTIATMLLAEGKRDEAIKHFRLGVTQGGGTSIDYTLCKAYWKRLEGDDRWLSEGPH